MCSWPRGMAIMKPLQGEVFTSRCGKISNQLLFSKIAVFLMYREIYVHIFAIIKQCTQHTGVCIVLKMKQYWLKSILRGSNAVVILTRVSPCYMFGNICGTTWFNKMAAPFLLLPVHLASFLPFNPLGWKGIVIHPEPCERDNSSLIACTML